VGAENERMEIDGDDASTFETEKASAGDSDGVRIQSRSDEDPTPTRAVTRGSSLFEVDLSDEEGQARSEQDGHGSPAEA
jgi:hypothetical protein